MPCYAPKWLLFPGFAQKPIISKPAATFVMCNYSKYVNKVVIQPNSQLSTVRDKAASRVILWVRPPLGGASSNWPFACCDLGLQYMQICVSTCY
jgi:hypothetical protein